MKTSLGMCQINGCKNLAHFGLYHTIGDAKSWIYVCPYHERIVGNENLLRARRNASLIQPIAVDTSHS